MIKFSSMVMCKAHSTSLSSPALQLMCDMQVSIVAFKKGKLQVLSHAWDRNLGGRDFDEVLFDHFCEEFGGKHKIDIKSNARASFRLRMACEKASCYGKIAAQCSGHARRFLAQSIHIFL